MIDSIYSNPPHNQKKKRSNNTSDTKKATKTHDFKRLESNLKMLPFAPLQILSLRPAKTIKRTERALSGPDQEHQVYVTRSMRSKSLSIGY